MEIDHIKLLLTRYFKGDTTLEEERALQQFFTGEGEIPAELTVYKNQFILIKTAAADKPDPRKVEEKIAEMIDNESISSSKKPGRILVRLAVAASVALMIGITGLLIYQKTNSSARDTFTDPRLAYNEAQKALLFVSQKMNKGIAPLSNVTKITTGTDKLRSLEKMDESLGMLNLVSIINRSSNLKK